MGCWRGHLVLIWRRWIQWTRQPSDWSASGISLRRCWAGKQQVGQLCSFLTQSIGCWLGHLVLIWRRWIQWTRQPSDWSASGISLRLSTYGAGSLSSRLDDHAIFKIHWGCLVLARFRTLRLSRCVLMPCKRSWVYIEPALEALIHTCICALRLPSRWIGIKGLIPSHNKSQQTAVTLHDTLVGLTILPVSCSYMLQSFLNRLAITHILVTHMATWIWVNINSGLLSDSTKPLPEWICHQKIRMQMNADNCCRIGLK